MSKRLISIIAVFFLALSSFAQSSRQLSLDNVIDVAQQSSPRSVMARHNLRSNYWQYRSFKADLLPTLNLGGSLGNFNRSLVSLQNSTTGEINYVENYNLKNSLTLSVDQNVALTGGTVSVYSSLSRIDEYKPFHAIKWNSQPVNISYFQPLNSYNSLKWSKRIEPKVYEKAKRQYLEDMENITLTASNYFFSLLQRQISLKIAKSNYENTSALYSIAQQRFNIGRITRDELLQLELRMLNDKMSISDATLEYDRTKLALSNFLGYSDNSDFELLMPSDLPSVSLDYQNVLELAMQNGTISLSQDISMLEAESSVAKANSVKGLTASLRAQFGLTQRGETLGAAYQNPMDQEILGLTFSIPIMDWGRRKGSVKMAESRQEVVKSQLEQELSEYRQTVLLSVMRFNNQKDQCSISSKADTVSQERYNSTIERFKNGSVSVLEVNTARSERDQATLKYIVEISNYWNYYYTLRKYSLYDFVTQTNLSAEFDNVINQ